ncbi:FG-GAP-like repeat-containing protein [Ulvibacterium sp.]|uniref:FG-GAP-like repeat-containing protein n=1 Tax=Ulvibacterium sp. TaxID=2665914 RepID=UPI0026284B92|nr:FG-GAP-like repeat-containing protein [Ulvibacterium sp.]
MKAKNQNKKYRIFTIFLFLGISLTAFAQTDPTVTATAPSANALNADSTTDISLTFSETMDAATFTADHVKMSGSYGEPFGFPALRSNTNTAVFDPDRDFFPGEIITVTLTADVASSMGAPLASPFTYRFTAGVSPNSPGEFPNGRNIIGETVRSTSSGDVTAVDLDGDGDLDVLSASSDDSRIVWHANDGNGNFGSRQVIGGNSPKSLITGDLDNDGDLDILSMSGFGGVVHAHLNNGSENFTLSAGITTEVKDIASGDMDGDGDLDLLTASGNEIFIYPYEGISYISAPPVPVIFRTKRTITSAVVGASGVAVADLDGDGDLDVLSSSADDNKIAWYPNDGFGNFGGQQIVTQAATGAQNVLTADMDGDGDLDVISTDDTKTAWYPNDGNGNFGNQILLTEDDIRDVAVADLDGDRDLDVLSASGDENRIAWYQNDGNGNFGSQLTINLESINSAIAVAAGDLDGDGDLDVLSAHSSNSRIAWHENAGSTPLAANCAPPFTLQMDSDGSASITVDDIDDGSLGFTSMEIDISDFDCSDLGENTVTLTVTNASGDTETCTTTVTIEDSIAPVADRATLPEIVSGCGTSVIEVPTATDNCTGIVTASTNDPLEYSEQGTYTITWIYDDGNGNTSTQEQTLIVDDPETPVPDMAVLPEVRGECGATVTEVPTAVDNCSGTVTATTDDPLSYPEQGTYTITWTYDDGNGNTSTQEQTIIVENSIASATPDVASLPEVRGECSATITSAPTATADCGGTIIATTNDPLEYSEQGTFIVTWTYDIGNGNTSTQTQNVIVENPVTSVTPNMDVLPEVRGECSVTVSQVPTATSDCGGTVTATTNDPLTYEEQGTYTLIWTYDLGNGNTSTQQQTVIVEDLVPPLAIAQDITVGLDENGQATINAEDINNGSTDNCGIEDLALDVSIFDCPELGDTTVELTVTDVNGNSDTATATVTFTAPDSDSDGVADTCNPALALVPVPAISPNGDNANDTWVIENITSHPEALIKVFNRNGREVFSTQNYQNDWGGTEGTGSNLLPVGSYYYIIHLRQPVNRDLTGWLYLNY